MSQFEFRTIAISAAAVSLLSFIASSTQAQSPPIPQAPARAGAHTPPPNPIPPQATLPDANPGGGTNPANGAAIGPAGGANAGSEPGYLGVVADDRQENGAGVRVIELESGGPAEQGGLKADDLITRINDKPVHSQTDMGPILQRLAPGSKVKFAVDRGGKAETVEVTLGNRPPVGQRRFEKFGAIPEPLPEPGTGGGLGPEAGGAEPGRVPADVGPGAAPGGAPNGLSPVDPRIGDSVPTGVPDGLAPDPRPLHLGANNLPNAAPSHRPLLGVRTKPVTAETRQRLRLSSTTGALVVSRTAGSPAAQAGIPLDAVIIAVDGKPVVAPSDLTQFIAQAGAGREIEITYLFAGAEQRAKVRLAPTAANPSSLLGGGTVNVGDIPLPPAPQRGQLPMPDDKTRIDSLERRVQQLEHRLDDLEQTMRKAS